MPRRPSAPPPDVWTVFGRWRRPTRAGRALGVALLLLSLLLTVRWAIDPARAPVDPAPGSATASAGLATAPPTAPPATCAPGAPAAARPLTLPLDPTVGGADPWGVWIGEVVCLTHPLTVAEVYELLTRRRVLAAVERPWATTPADELLRGALLVRPAPGAERARLLPADPAATVAAGASGAGAWGLGSGELRNGDALEGLHGRLRLEGGAVVLEAPALTVRRLNPRPPAPPELGATAVAAPGVRGPTPRPADEPAGSNGSTVRIAGVNLLNWFVTLGDRGAATPAARERQAAKLVAALLALDADALALAEVENDDGRALDDLLRRLDEAQRAAGRDPAAAYRAARAPPGATGRDAIRVAIAYRPAVLTLLRTDADRAPVHDRPPLAAAFAHPDGSPAFTLVSVHHKAKSGCPATGDVDRGSGCWDLRRDAQSQALLDFAARLALDPDDPPVLIVGDLNAYRHEAPVGRFADAGWRVLVDGMPPERAYSYVHFGRAGALDHAVASPALAPRVVGAAFWPINADEPPHADGDRPTPYRSSDHDPLLLALRWD